MSLWVNLGSNISFLRILKVQVAFWNPNVFLSFKNKPLNRTKRPLITYLKDVPTLGARFYHYFLRFDINFLENACEFNRGVTWRGELK